MAITPNITLNTLLFSQVASLIKEVMAHPMDFGCVGLCGAPGIGKTKIIEQTAEKLNKGLSYINCTLVSPGDLLGAAFPSQDRKYTDFLPTRMLDEKNVIFFDELANGSNEIMNLANRTMLDGDLNGRKFKEARFFAYNPTSVSELANELPSILVNKAALFVVDYRHDDFLRYALNEGHKKIHPGVAAFIAETKGAYLMVKDYHPLKHDGVDLPAPGSPFPSPRAFELFSNLYKRVESGAFDLNTYEAAYATLGGVSGKKIADYLVCAKYLPKVSKILAGTAEEFPEEAFVDGSVMTPIAMMTLYNILSATGNKTEMENGSKWLFEMVKKNTLGTELLKTYSAALQESRFRDTYATVVGAIGKDVLGEAAFGDFIAGAIHRDISAGKF